MALDAEKVAEWKRIADAATPGPWIGSRDLSMLEVAPDDGSPAADEPPVALIPVTPADGSVATREFLAHYFAEGVSPSSWDRGYANSDFIAAAREAVPALLAEVERLTAERDAADRARVIARQAEIAAKTEKNAAESSAARLREVLRGVESPPPRCGEVTPGGARCVCVDGHTSEHRFQGPTASVWRWIDSTVSAIASALTLR